MLSGLSLVVFLLVAARSTGQPCLCSGLLPAGLKVNCSSLNLVALSHLPSDTAELHLQDNQLTSLPPGLFDGLVGLEQVSLTGNPFHCDCRIQYLRNWLLKNEAIVSKQPRCTSPGPVAQTAISELSDDYFSACAVASRAGGPFNIMMGVTLGCLILLLLWSLRVAKMSAITLHIDERHAGLQTDSLRPKHRRRVNTGPSEVSPDSHSRWFQGSRQAPYQHEAAATSAGPAAQKAQYQDKPT